MVGFLAIRCLVWCTQNLHGKAADIRHMDICIRYMGIQCTCSLLVFVILSYLALVVASATLHAGHEAISAYHRMEDLSVFLDRRHAAPSAGAPCAVCVPATNTDACSPPAQCIFHSLATVSSPSCKCASYIAHGRHAACS